MATDDDDSPTGAYASQVADIIFAQPRDSTYVPPEPLELRVTNRRAIATLDELEPDERAQFVAMFRGEDAEQILRDGIEDFPIDLEVAHVVDDAGALRYRLYGWNFGVIYLMPPSGLDVVAFTSQHHLEHWSADLRPTFWAMDRALMRGDHGFQQSAEFCWWREECWERIKNLAPGTAYSEAHVRRFLRGD